MLRISKDSFKDENSISLDAKSLVYKLYTSIILKILTDAERLGNKPGHKSALEYPTVMDVCDLFAQEVMLGKDLPASYIKPVHDAIVERGFTPVYEE